MSNKRIDEPTGVETVGHEWDGIEELNNPLPRWWLISFYLTILFAIGYMVVYPAWPLLNKGTEGLWGWSSRGQLAKGVVAEGAEGWPAGLAAYVVAKGARPQVRQSSAAIAVVFGKKSGPQIGAMDEGSLRHPTFGHKPWVPQEISAGGVSKALEDRLPRVREAVAKRVNDFMEGLG